MIMCSHKHHVFFFKRQQNCHSQILDQILGGRRGHRWVVESCRSQTNPTLQEFVVSATAHGFSSSVAADGFQGFL